MILSEIEAALSSINGCTFASLDAATYPKPGLRKVTSCESVILFTNKKSSGYENMVRRRLAAVGKNPDTFTVGDLPWGSRIPETPLIEHEGEFYLQTILLKEGDTSYYVGNHAVDPSAFGVKPRRTNQGLPRGDEVVVNTYALSSITRLAVMGEDFLSTDRPKRPKLGLKY